MSLPSSLDKGFPDDEFVGLALEMISLDELVTLSGGVLLRLSEIRKKGDAKTLQKMNSLPEAVLAKVEALEKASPSPTESAEPSPVDILMDTLRQIYSVHVKGYPVFTKMLGAGRSHLAALYRDWLEETSLEYRKSLLLE